MKLKCVVRYEFPILISRLQVSTCSFFFNLIIFRNNVRYDKSFQLRFPQLVYQARDNIEIKYLKKIKYISRFLDFIYFTLLEQRYFSTLFNLIIELKMNQNFSILFFIVYNLIFGINFCTLFFFFLFDFYIMVDLS